MPPASRRSDLPVESSRYQRAVDVESRYTSPVVISVEEAALSRLPGASTPLNALPMLPMPASVPSPPTVTAPPALSASEKTEALLRSAPSVTVNTEPEVSVTLPAKLDAAPSPIEAVSLERVRSAEAPETLSPPSTTSAVVPAGAPVRVVVPPIVSDCVESSERFAPMPTCESRMRMPAPPTDACVSTAADMVSITVVPVKVLDVKASVVVAVEPASALKTRSPLPSTVPVKLSAPVPAPEVATVASAVPPEISVPA